MDSFIRATGAALQTAGTAKKSFHELKVVQRSKDAYKEWTTVEPFPYEALPTPTSIRLLKLEPSKAMEKAAKSGKPVKSDAHDDDDDISFIMQAAELDRRPLFTALSYTWRRQHSHITTWGKWVYHYLSDLIQEKPTDYALPDPDGDLRATRKVTCNGHQMMVSENLFEALKQLRRDKPGAWLWVDAVCMNQRDSVELAAQIQIMGRIYQSAQLVVVWLGPFPRIAENSLKRLNEIAESDEPLPANLLYLSRIGSRMTDEDRRIASAALFAFHLASRSYFKRVWVVQELCLARNVTYLHGKHEIGLQTLLTSCKWFVDKDSRRETAEFAADNNEIMVPYFTTHMRFLPTTLAARKEFSKGNKWTLIQWFRACNGRLASVGKDYVFAGLSLVREDLLAIDQDLQVVVTTPPPLPRRPIGGRDSGGKYIAADLSSKFSAQAPTASQSLTPRGLWRKLAPNYSASDAEVFINAAACLLSHSSVEDLLRLAARLRDKHQFGELDYLRPRDLEAFSGLPSWTPAIGSWTSCLTSDLIPPDVQSPFKASTAPHGPVAYKAGALPSSRRSISADGRTLSLSAAVIDHVHVYADEKNSLQGFEDIIGLLRFLDQPSALYSAQRDDSFQLAQAGRDGNDSDESRSTPCFLEAVACTMVAGQIGGKRVTPFQAGSWLCESIESKVQEMIVKTQRTVSSQQDIKQKLEAKAAKRGHDEEYLKTAEDDKDAKKWRICNEDLKQNLEKVAEATTKLEALKVRYSHLKWLAAGTAAVVYRKEDVERALLERRNSKEKQLDEMVETSSIDTKSSSSIRDALNRAKAKTTEITDEWTDRVDIWELERKGKIRRVLSDECSTFEEAFEETLSWRRICLTNKGYILLGPLWVEKGDTVMILPGVSVPFIFAQEKEDLEREKARIEERRSHVDVDSDDNGEIRWEATKGPQEARLVQIEERLQTIAEEHCNRWVLVGEAYIEGIMQGEAAANLDYRSIEVQ